MNSRRTLIKAQKLLQIRGISINEQPVRLRSDPGNSDRFEQVTVIPGGKMYTPKKQVLCVEDDDATCELLKFMLPDYELTTVGSISEALSRVGNTRFDLYLLDRGLPDG